MLRPDDELQRKDISLAIMMLIEAHALMIDGGCVKHLRWIQWYGSCARLMEELRHREWRDAAMRWQAVLFRHLKADGYAELLTRDINSKHGLGKSSRKWKPTAAATSLFALLAMPAPSLDLERQRKR
jgi:hypothetical protein